MKRYISDQHFFSEKVMTAMDHRPFASADEMNRYMIRRWNEKVEGGDHVFVVGDMFDWKYVQDADRINRVLHLLKGRISLILGNHDFSWINKPGIDLSRFAWIEYERQVRDGRREVLLNHYPMPVFGGNHVRDEEGNLKIYMVHGHVHDTKEAELLYDMEAMAAQREFVTAKGKREKMYCNLINCFCGYSDYQPLSLSEWIALRDRNYGRKGNEVSASVREPESGTEVSAQLK